MTQIQIIDVAARDGLQSEPEVMPTSAKRELIGRLVEAGIRKLEVASFVHPKLVPQMADSDALVPQLPQRDDVSYIGLALNDRGVDRALAAGVDEIGFVIVSTETYNQKNQRATVAESIASYRRLREQTRAAGIACNVTLAAAFGCPYEGEVHPDQVMRIADAVLEDAPDELAIADSIGVGVPKQVHDLLGRLRERSGDIPLRCHFHNTRNTGIANALAAVDAGVTSLDASVGGIGGCPFAPAATGNIATEDLLYALERSGVTTGVSLEAIVAASHWLAEQLQHEVPALVARAGGFPEARAAA
ncbi:MAG: hydroxymethylglutaryl-CoA lyase [Pseudomonadota bacterium]